MNWSQLWLHLWDGEWEGPEIVSGGSGGMPLWAFGDQFKTKSDDGEEKRRRRKKRQDEDVIAEVFS